MLNDYVDKIFVINLPHRTDRLKRFHELSQIYNFTYDIIEGLNGKEITNDLAKPNILTI